MPDRIRNSASSIAWTDACIVATLTGLLPAVSAHADVTGKGEAGLVIATGNSDTQSANAKVKVANEVGDWKHEAGLSGMYASDSNNTTAQRWEGSAQSDYNFSPKTFWFGAARYERDEFSGFEYQATASAGLGRKFIDNERTKFNGTAGLGYKFFETRDAFDENGVLITPGGTDSQLVLRSTLDYEHGLTGTTTLVDKFILEAGADNTYLQNDISLQVKMTEVLALAVGYSLRHNTAPPSGFDKTDTLTTVNLVYELK
jgi:putative salt-induced outer membrane protein